ncbi:TnsD family Tn7-like transposition protein [Cohnella suwonensis]|uniref:TnsD family Tn7-like transposition protein n=1 Tax=Cohnella suwonensis TaxID=696072 RepID=A0ABW0LV93_9BACL
MIMFQTFPGELLFSAFARYHAYSGNTSCKKTMIDLFGSSNVCAVPDLPCHLDKLCERIPGKAMKAEYVLRNHTFYPYYEPFINEKKRDAMFYEMIHGSGKNLFMKVGLPANGVKNNTFLQFCDSCIYEDRIKIGTSYWHRSHQLPGVKVCHLHHIWLRESSIFFTQRRNKHEFISLEIYLQNSAYKAKMQLVCEDMNQLFLAKASNEIVQDGDTEKKIVDFQEKYFSKLGAMNLVFAKGGASIKNIIPAFVSHWGEELLNRLGCNVSLEQNDSWLHKLLRKQRVDLHPLRHILMHGFLQLVFNDEQTEVWGRKMPFGQAPWICVNKASTHYGEKVIQHCVVSRCSKTGKSVGTFYCDCGFVFSRKGPDKQQQDRLRIGRIKVFGPVWRQRLMEMMNDDSLSLREKGRRLGVDPTTVKNQCKLVTSIESKNQKSILPLGSSNRSEKKTAKRKVEAHSKIRVNWSERDNFLAKQIITKASQLTSNPKVRVTRTELARQIRSLSLIQTKIDKLPKTKKELSIVEESKVQFIERRKLRRANM